MDELIVEQEIPEVIKKTKRTKKEKRSLEIYKTYLSSLTARSCKYLYFNCANDKNMLVFTNADQTTLMQESYTLSFHLFKMKSYSFKTDFMEELGFNEINLSSPYMIHLSKVLKILNDCLKNNLSIKAYADTNNQLLLTSNDDDREMDELIESYSREGRERLLRDLDGNLLLEEYGLDNDDFEDKEDILNHIQIPQLEYSHAFGTNFDDYRNYQILKREVNYIEDIYQNLNKLPHIKVDIPELIKTRINSFIYELDLDKFIDNDGNFIYDDNYLKKYNILIQDGLDVPSIKEFVSKLPEDFQVTLYVFIDKSKQIKLITVCENDDFEIISMRPLIGLNIINKS